MVAPDDDDPAVDWPADSNAQKTEYDAQPLGLIADVTPSQPAEVPVQLFAGYDAGKEDGLREGKIQGRREGRVDGVYEVIQDLRAVLVAGKNDPAFVETCTTLLARRARVPWPPPEA